MFGFTAGDKIRDFSTINENIVSVRTFSKRQQNKYADMWKRGRQYHGNLLKKERLQAVAEGRWPRQDNILSKRCRPDDADHKNEAVAEAEAAANEQKRRLMEALMEDAERNLLCMHF